MLLSGAFVYNVVGGIRYIQLRRVNGGGESWGVSVDAVSLLSGRVANYMGEVFFL